MSLLTINEIKDMKYSLSSSMYEHRIVRNGIPIINLIADNKFKNKTSNSKSLLSDKAVIHGSGPITKNKYANSSYIILKARGIMNYSTLPILYGKGINNIIPTSFNNYHLHKNDLIISKDSNIGNAIILDKNYNHLTLSNALYHPIFKTPKYKWLSFAYFSSDLYHNQLNTITPKGATIRHAKSNVFKIKIPKLGKKIQRKLIMLVKDMINSDRQNKGSYTKALNIIEATLNLKKINNTDDISINNIKKYNRLDSSFYDGIMLSYKKLLSSEKFPIKTIHNLGLHPYRGPSLSHSAIKYFKTSNRPFPNSVPVIKAGNLSRYGFPISYSYFGTNHKLKKLCPGDILFGAEASNRSFVVSKRFVENHPNIITNYHGLMIRNVKNNPKRITSLSVMIKYLLDYYREVGIISGISTGGHGGSLAPTYWANHVKFPILPKNIQIDLYHIYIESINRWASRCLDHNKINQIFNTIV